MHTLSHPNVMSLTGVCLDAAGGLVVVMPYMSRGSVLHYLQKERGKLVPPTDADYSVVCAVIRKYILAVIEPKAYTHDCIGMSEVNIIVGRMDNKCYLM